MRATEIYASELLDRNTCGPCERVDGHRFSTMAEARAAYPSGIYRACEGGPRCRGTLVVVWEETNLEAAPEDLLDSFREDMRKRVVPAAAASFGPGEYLPGIMPSDGLWVFRDGWAHLRHGNVRVRMITPKNWVAEVQVNGRWVTEVAGIWARISEIPMLRNLLPPGYNWPIVPPGQG